MTYIAAEPEAVTAYVDRKGKFHSTRDAAIDANFGYDIDTAVCAILDRSPRLRDKMPVFGSMHLIKEFVAQNPDLVRVMLGDRDPT